MGIIGYLKLLDRVSMPRFRLNSDLYDSLWEATAAVNAGAPRAACVMLRRVVERFCADLGATGSLHEKLVALQRDSGVRPSTVAGLDALRLLGNDAAHLEGRYYDHVTMEDAVEAHALVVRLISDA